MLSKEGNFDLVLENQTEMSEEDLRATIPLERKASQLKNAEMTFKQAIANLKTKLLSNPDFIELMKYQDKLTIARQLKRNTETILDNEYKKIFAKQGIESKDIASIYSDALPALPPKTGKRGRPKKEAL
jgi:hypothetical protein